MFRCGEWISKSAQLLEEQWKLLIETNWGLQEWFIVLLLQSCFVWSKIDHLIRQHQRIVDVAWWVWSIFDHTKQDCSNRTMNHSDKMRYVLIVIALGKFRNFSFIQIYRNSGSAIILDICVVHYLRSRHQLDGCVRSVRIYAG